MENTWAFQRDVVAFLARYGVPMGDVRHPRVVNARRHEAVLTLAGTTVEAALHRGAGPGDVAKELVRLMYHAFWCAVECGIDLIRHVDLDEVWARRAPQPRPVQVLDDPWFAAELLQTSVAAARALRSGDVGRVAFALAGVCIEVVETFAFWGVDPYPLWEEVKRRDLMHPARTNEDWAAAMEKCLADQYGFADAELVSWPVT